MYRYETCYHSHHHHHHHHHHHQNSSDSHNLIIKFSTAIHRQRSVNYKHSLWFTPSAWFPSSRVL